MRFGRGRRPRRRDPRRRFRNRLLLGMVTVALLPLLAFAVLAVFELDTVAKSTANATETAILEHQQALASSALGKRAFVLDSSMSAIDSAVQEGLGEALTKAINKTPVNTPLPTQMTPLGASFQFSSNLNSTLILPAGITTGGRFAAASADTSILAQVQAIFRVNKAIQSVWFQDEATGAIRAYPAFDPSLAPTPLYDPKARATILSRSEGGITAASAPNVWIQPGSPGHSEDGPFWTDPYELLESGSTGVSAWYQNPSSIQVGVDISVQALVAQALVAGAPASIDPVVISAAGTVLYSAQSAQADFPTSSSGPQVSSPEPELASSLRRMELTGATPSAPLTASFNKVSTDVFTSPIYSSHWIVLNPVPVSTLEPNLSQLTLGVTDSVHRLFPVTVLPVLILLVGLAFIATTLLSRRMYLPVQALTDHAVLEERTRLAREIHDTLAQQLTGIVLELEAADTLLVRGSERRAKSSVERARELARGALQEARSSVWNLRPAPLSATGLVAAIGHEVEAWEERTGIPARFRARAVPPHPPLSPTAEVALLRIGQEALSNAARHGKPEHVDVELRAHAQELILSIRDDGVGFDPAASAPREDCFGLDGMAERARNAGGSLTVVSAPGHGTTVTTRLPFSETLAEAVSA
jgi:signal transduction histidine kinase